MAENKKENIFTPKRTVKFFIVSYITLLIACMIIWPLMDIIFSAAEGKPYEGWNVGRGLVEPLIFALIFTIIEFVFWNFFHKKKQ